MPGFQSTRLVTEGTLEPFFFLYADDSIQGNPETCKQSSIMLNYEVKNNEVSEAKKYYIKLKKLQSCHSDELKQNIYFEATRQIRTAYYEKLLSVNDWRYTLEDSLMLHTKFFYFSDHISC